jgi:3-carboxy-cis,cis-muconate cycloisomerase
VLFAPLFVPDQVAEAVGDRAWLQAMLDVEAALARAEASAGIIPAAAAETIAGCCRAERFDPGEIALQARGTGNPAEPLVRALRRAVREDAARYVHHGATSQDILDTAGMLVARAALKMIEAELAALAAALAGLARGHGDTLMAGRTLLQQALPVTFGLRAALWLSGVTQAHAALRRVRNECLAAQLGGAAGTLAALGEPAIRVLRDFARQLNLREPDLPWHTERSRIARIGAELMVTAGALDKIALDITLLAQTEVGEVSEGGAGGGSSTLPQKRNPVGAVMTRACAREALAGAETLVRAMGQELERGAGSWQAEWPALTSALAYTGGDASWLRTSVESLQVHPERMRANLEVSNGLVMAERVALLLSERIGREEAHALIRQASDRVTAGEGSLGEVLAADEEVRRHLSREDIDRAMDPAMYLGASQTFIDRALAVWGSAEPNSSVGVSSADPQMSIFQDV